MRKMSRLLLLALPFVVPSAPASAISTAEVTPLKVNDTLPAPLGFTQASNCVAHEGVHYVRQEDKTLSPILAYDEAGKLVSLEYIIPEKYLRAGASWRGLPGAAGRSIDHVDIDFYPASRPANAMPYYSVHLYFIDGKAQQRICPKSIEVEPVGRATQNQ